MFSDAVLYDVNVFSTMIVFCLLKRLIKYILNVHLLFLVYVCVLIYSCVGAIVLAEIEMTFCPCSMQYC